MIFPVVEKIFLGATAIVSLLTVKEPVYFTQEQLDRTMVVKTLEKEEVKAERVEATIEEEASAAAILASPSPTPKPFIEKVASEAAEMETEFGKIKVSGVIRGVWAMSYDSTCAGCSTTTATGMKQGYGVVAVDPKVIPLYSKVYVPGYGIAVAGDVGGAVKGKKIDLGYDSLSGQWSAHFVDVYLLE